MINKQTNVNNKIVWCLTVLLITSFTVFETYRWGKFIFLGVAIIVYGLYCLRTGSFLFPLESYQKFLMAFTIFTFVTSIWALSFSDAIEKGTTLFQILIVFSLMYIYYRDLDGVDSLLSAIKWAGYLVSLYTIYFFGLNILLSSTSASRLANAFSNVNNIGLICALACVIQIFELLHKGLKWEVLFTIPCILVISATQSRKALICLAMGLFLITAIKNLGEGKTLKSLRGVCLAIIIIVVVYFAISNIPMFSGLYERMQRMLYSINGTGLVDHSTLIRNEMVRLGIDWWVKYPIGGIGIGSPHIIALQYVGADHYLHNNYVELLCGGGLVGFCLYYSIYAYIIFQLIKLRRKDFRMFSFGITWMLIMLLMDYGMVSYYSQDQWFYLMVHFLNIRNMRKTGEKYEC